MASGRHGMAAKGGTKVSKRDIIEDLIRRGETLLKVMTSEGWTIFVNELKDVLDSEMQKLRKVTPEDLKYLQGYIAALDFIIRRPGEFANELEILREELKELEGGEEIGPTQEN